MSKKDTIPEVDIRVDEAAGVIREVKTRSKKDPGLHSWSMPIQAGKSRQKIPLLC